MQCTAIANAVHCVFRPSTVHPKMKSTPSAIGVHSIGTCSALRWHTHRTAFFGTAFPVVICLTSTPSFLRTAWGERIASLRICAVCKIGGAARISSSARGCTQKHSALHRPGMPDDRGHTARIAVRMKEQSEKHIYHSHTHLRNIHSSITSHSRNQRSTAHDSGVRPVAFDHKAQPSLLCTRSPQARPRRKTRNPLKKHAQAHSSSVIKC